MSLIINLKKMFKNNAELNEFRNQYISHRMVYVDDRHYYAILKPYNIEDFENPIIKSTWFKKWSGIFKHSSFIWMVSLEYSTLDQWLQVSEVFDSCILKIYNFNHQILIVAGMSVYDIRHILKDVRYKDNLIIYNLKEDLYKSGYKFMYRDLIDSGVLEDRFIRNTPEHTDEDFKSLKDKDFIDGVKALKIVAFDDPSVVSDSIVSGNRLLEQYSTDKDVFDLCKVHCMVEMTNMTMSQITNSGFYRASSVINPYIKDDENNPKTMDIETIERFYRHPLSGDFIDAVALDNYNIRLCKYMVTLSVSDIYHIKNNLVEFEGNYELSYLMDVLLLMLQDHIGYWLTDKYKESLDSWNQISQQMMIPEEVKDQVDDIPDTTNVSENHIV